MTIISSDTSHYENVPFEIPEGWCWCMLPDICIIPITDGTHQTPKYTTREEGIPFLSSKDVTKRIIDWSSIKYITRDLHDVLYSRIAPQKFDILLAKNGTTGVAAMVEDDRVFDIYVTLAVIRPAMPYIHPNYLLHIINSHFCKLQFNSHLTGIGLPNLHLTDINKTYIPVPPYNEQCRIVERLENLLSVVDNIENCNSNIRESIQSAKSKVLDLAIHGKLVPQDANDEPAPDLLRRINPKAVASCDNPHYANIPSSWVCTTMGSIFQHNTGKALNKSASTEGALLPYLTTSNVYWNTFDLSVVKEMRFKESETDKCTIRKGDLLVCEGGDIGRAAIWDKDYSICIQNHLHRLRPKGEVLPLLYLYYIMYLKLTNNLEGKGIGLQGFSSGLLDKLEVPLPPYNEQIRIVDKIQETFNMLDSIAESLN